jgi:hypothetical protein
MPTLNPRTNVTLSPSLDLLVQRLAVHQRCSKAQVLRELLETVQPSLTRAVALMDAAAKASPEVLAGLAKSFERAQERAEDVLAGAISRIDQAQGDLVTQAEVVRGRRPQRDAKRHGGGDGGAPNPPSSNRGVKSGKPSAQGHAATPRPAPSKTLVGRRRKA